MKLTLYAPDIEARKITRRWGEKRLSDVKTILANRELIQLEPLSHNGSVYTAIRPAGLDTTPEGSVLRFVPISCRVFLVYDRKSSELQKVVLELGSNGSTKQTQFTVDMQFAETVKNSKDQLSRVIVGPGDHRTSGPGVDPQVVEESQKVLGKLLKTDNAHPLVRELQNFLWEKFA